MHRNELLSIECKYENNECKYANTLIALITYRTLCIVDPISLTPSSISSYKSLRLRPYAQEDIYKHLDGSPDSFSTSIKKSLE